VAVLRVRKLSADDVSLIATIDRSEHVDVEYAVIDGRLTERPVTMTDVPPWDASGSGPHSVAAKIAFCASAIADGGVLLGAFDAASPAGFAVVDPAFEARLAWLAFLHVSRPHRRRGAARALWDEAVSLAVAADAASLYVSATPTGSAVGFYLRQGCQLADPPHPVLFDKEPEDIHFVRRLP
jgi:ribosomal protein S18 acetylase RimI-like enzyme